MHLSLIIEVNVCSMSTSKMPSTVDGKRKFVISLLLLEFVSKKSVETAVIALHCSLLFVVSDRTEWATLAEAY